MQLQEKTILTLKENCCSSFAWKIFETFSFKKSQEKKKLSSDLIRLTRRNATQRNVRATPKSKGPVRLARVKNQKGAVRNAAPARLASAESRTHLPAYRIRTVGVRACLGDSARLTAGGDPFGDARTCARARALVSGGACSCRC